MVIYEPALLMIGDWPTIIGAFVTASAGILLFAAGLHGFLITKTSHWQRAVLVVAGLLLIDPGLITDIIGAALAGVVILSQLAARKAAALVPAEPKPVESTP
jgi:TRAP-type uncharacterized transport system fused permease subunit